MKRWKVDLGLCVVAAVVLLAASISGGAQAQQPVGLLNYGTLTVIKTSMDAVATTGAETVVGTVPAGQVWVVHSVLVNFTTDYDCTGDDCTFVVGTSDDVDGFFVAADAAMQIADTEGTGWEAGWQGQDSDEIGVFLEENNAAFVIDATSAAVDITATAAEASGDTMTAGDADVYVTYTRIK